jgi:predicted metalloprotease with PDZ domain
VIGDLPAESAGISPGMKLIAVNGRRYSESLLHDVVGGARDSSEPISLLIENGEFFKTYRIDYQGGDRYPHLIRNTAKTDLLEKIFNRASKTTQK